MDQGASEPKLNKFPISQVFLRRCWHGVNSVVVDGNEFIDANTPLYMTNSLIFPHTTCISARPSDTLIGPPLAVVMWYLPKSQEDTEAAIDFLVERGADPNVMMLAVFEERWPILAYVALRVPTDRLAALVRKLLAVGCPMAPVYNMKYTYERDIALERLEPLVGDTHMVGGAHKSAAKKK